jgi:hypothetical protein
MTLNVGADKKASFSIQGKGAILPLPAMPLHDDPSVTAQLVNAAGVCWQTTVAAPAKNTSKKFQDKK